MLKYGAKEVFFLPNSKPPWSSATATSHDRVTVLQITNIGKCPKPCVLNLKLRFLKTDTIIFKWGRYMAFLAECFGIEYLVRSYINIVFPTPKAW